METCQATLVVFAFTRVVGLDVAHMMLGQLLNGFLHFPVERNEHMIIIARAVLQGNDKKKGPCMSHLPTSDDLQPTIWHLQLNTKEIYN